MVRGVLAGFKRLFRFGRRRGAGRAVAPAVAGLALVLGGALVSASCSVQLGKEPFGCSDGKTCPTGYSCQASVCVVDGDVPNVTRPLRVTYINRSEMYWFASPKGGATLVVNDGFSPGARGIFEVHVSADGHISPTVKLLGFPAEQTVSSAIVALDETHYGVVTMSFPGALEDGLVLALHSLPRDGSAPPNDVVLHSDTYPYLGGYEPAYVGGVVRGDDVVFAFTDPGAGGSIVVTRLKKDGTLVSQFRIPLPAGVLPLSGDCIIWRNADNRLMMRVGLDVMRVFSLDIDQGTATPVATSAGTPLFGFGGSVVYLEPNADNSQVTYVLRDLNGAMISSSPVEPFTDGLEPYTAVAYGAGALVAPLSTDPSFPTMDVAYVGPDGSFARVASVERPGNDGLYTARAFATEGKAYIAWTSFHDQLMDLWIGVSPLTGVP
jgi:hypothetical protein